MTGKGHILTGTFIAADVCTLSYVIMQHAPDSAKDFALKVNNFINPVMHYQLTALADSDQVKTIQMSAVSVFFCIVLYIIGLLLPDIDHSESTLSKAWNIKLKTPHRGLTHSVWFIFPFILLGTLRYPFFFLVTGIIVHDIMDAFSKGGICPLYPLGRYRVYCGTVIRPSSKRIGYKAGKLSEKVFVAGVIAVSVFLMYRL